MTEQEEHETPPPPQPMVVQSVPRPHRKSAPIVPSQNIAGRALVSVIAIMTFLSCLTLGAVSLVSDSASVWEN